jgi:hypothetical protein
VNFVYFGNKETSLRHIKNKKQSFFVAPWLHPYAYMVGKTVLYWHIRLPHRPSCCNSPFRGYSQFLIYKHIIVLALSKKKKKKPALSNLCCVFLFAEDMHAARAVA